MLACSVRKSISSFTHRLQLRQRQTRPDFVGRIGARRRVRAARLDAVAVLSRRPFHLRGLQQRKRRSSVRRSFDRRPSSSRVRLTRPRHPATDEVFRSSTEVAKLGPVAFAATQRRARTESHLRDRQLVVLSYVDTVTGIVVFGVHARRRLLLVSLRSTSVIVLVYSLHLRQSRRCRFIDSMKRQLSDTLYVEFIIYTISFPFL